MARKAISDKPRLIDLHKAGLPRAIARLQKREIAKMERLLRNAEAVGHGAETASRVRQSIKAAIGSGQFRHFIETTEAQDGYQWPIAVLSDERIRKLELRDSASVVRISSDTASQNDHRAKWIKISTDEWENIQKVIDGGKWIIEADKNKRVVWDGPDGDGKYWKVVFKESREGELFLMTFHRLKRKQVTGLEEIWDGGE